jgi:hypothetical protein
MRVQNTYADARKYLDEGMCKGLNDAIRLGEE